MGPMQFLPGTWSRYAADGNGDGKADVQNVFDSTLTAARYLCSGGLNLRDQSQVMSAILRYNNSMAYAQNVLGWAAAYATGVVPVDLPPITGPIPRSPTCTWTTTRASGLDLPMNALGLPANDPLAVVPLFDLGRTDVAEPDGERADVRAAAGTGRREHADDDAARPGAEPAAVDAEPAAVAAAAAAAAAELRGVLPGHEPARGGTAAAAARGTAAGSRRTSGRAGRDGTAARWPKSRHRLRATCRSRRRQRHSYRRAPDRRPARLPDRGRARGRIGQTESAYTRR